MHRLGGESRVNGSIESQICCQRQNLQLNLFWGGKRPPWTDPATPSSHHAAVRRGAAWTPRLRRLSFQPITGEPVRRHTGSTNNLCRTSFHNVMGHIITVILDLFTSRTGLLMFQCTQLRGDGAPKRHGLVSPNTRMHLHNSHLRGFTTVNIFTHAEIF